MGIWERIRRSIFFAGLVLLVSGPVYYAWCDTSNGEKPYSQSRNNVRSGQIDVSTADSAPQDKRIVEKLGEHVPLDLLFTDEKGRSLTLGQIIDRPTIILPIYYTCPNICSQNLANLAAALRSLHFVPGSDFRVIALSFNERETAQDAVRAKRNYLKIAGPQFPADQWWYLTGSEKNIKELTSSVGFRFERLDSETYIHPAALVIVAGDGKIIRYVYGTFLAGDIDIAISAAKSGIVSQSVKRLLDFCFNYDPDKNKSVFVYVKLVILIVFICSGIMFFIYLKRNKKNRLG